MAFNTVFMHMKFGKEEDLGDIVMYLVENEGVLIYHVFVCLLSLPQVCSWFDLVLVLVLYVRRTNNTLHVMAR